jgi:chemotaxis protein CheD
VVYGLGSCVVVCLYDPLAHVGGMLHALLPGRAWSDNGNGHKGKPTKFVDRGLPLLVDTLVALGAQQRRLIAHLCGGAKMINAPGFDDTMNIGERNVLAAQTVLHVAGFRVKAEATGGQAGRTVKLHLANGQVTVKTLGQAEEILNGES